MKIEKNIPLPPAGLRQTLRELAASPIGASVFIPKNSFATDSVRGSIQAIGSKWATSRKVTENGVDGLRVWKISNPPKARRL